MVKSKLSARKRSLLVLGEFAALGAASAILLVFLASTLDGSLIKNGQGAAVITSILVDLVNTDRESNNIGGLEVNSTLTAIAQAKADDMAQKSYFAHTSPDGHDPWYWFQQMGYKFSYAGENLAVDFSDSADVERAWMNSPTHRANLLNAHFTQIGIATAVGTYNGHQTTFVVQEFGTPAHTTETASAPQDLTPSAAPTELAVAKTEPAATTPIVAAATAPERPVATSQSSVTTEPATTSAGTQGAPTAEQGAILGSGATGLAAPEPSVYDQVGLTALWNVFAASPKTTLRYAYYLFGLLILVALVIETSIEIKKHHVKHVFLALALLVLMGALFIAANTLVFTTPVIPDSSATTLGAL